MLTIRPQQMAELAKYIFRDEQNAVIVPVSQPSQANAPASGAFIIREEEFSRIGNFMYAERMRHFLNDQFPETMAIPPKKLDEAIVELTERAADYKLVLETQVAPFIVGAWVMGIHFNEDFETVKSVLNDLEMSSNAKAEWLWQFLEESVAVLEGDVARSE